MKEQEFNKIIRHVNAVLKASFFVIILLLGLIIYFLTDVFEPFKEKASTPPIVEKSENEIINGIHVETGLIDGKGLSLVIQNCTPCHSSKLITQNRMSIDGWKTTIRWMQDTQKLWDLGVNEEAILTYLATNYAPQKKGRRAVLTNIEWYELD